MCALDEELPVIVAGAYLIVSNVSFSVTNVGLNGAGHSQNPEPSIGEAQAACTAPPPIIASVLPFSD